MQFPFRFALVIILLSNFSSSVAIDCDVSGGQILGIVEFDQLDEASGLVASRKNPGLLYSHNDSGDNATVFVLNYDGSAAGIIHLEGIEHIDFEDITMGSGPINGEDYLFIGDMGNNDYDRDVFFVYRFKEPSPMDYVNGVASISSVDITTFTLTTTRALDQDMETLMFDPTSQDLYILTKNHTGSEASIYKFTPTNEPSQDVISMESIGIIQRHFLVAGDVSPDGTRIAIRSGFNQGAWMWNRYPNASVEDTLVNTESCDLLLADEVQGEAIAFNPEGTGFFTTSEDEELGLNQPIFYYEIYDQGYITNQ